MVLGALPPSLAVLGPHWPVLAPYCSQSAAGSRPLHLLLPAPEILALLSAWSAPHFCLLSDAFLATLFETIACALSSPLLEHFAPQPHLMLCVPSLPYLLFPMIEMQRA